MSYIPEKAMHHAKAEVGQLDTDTGKLTIEPTTEGTSSLGWVLGAAGAGVAVAAAAAALFALRSSTPKKPARRRAPRKATAKLASKSPARRRRTSTKKTAEAA